MQIDGIEITSNLPDMTLDEARYYVEYVRSRVTDTVTDLDIRESSDGGVDLNWTAHGEPFLTEAKEMEYVHTLDELKELQALPLPDKIALSKLRIVEWYERHNGKVCVSYSGGKDSTVLLKLVRELYPEVPAVYVDTRLDYPEVREHVKATENVIWLKPDMNFREVIEKYGYCYPYKEAANVIYYARKGAHWANNYFQGLNADGSESVVMRVPYDLAAEMIANCPASGDLQELQSWIVRAAARSQKLREALKNHDLEEIK